MPNSCYMSGTLRPVPYLRMYFSAEYTLVQCVVVVHDVVDIVVVGVIDVEGVAVVVVVVDVTVHHCIAVCDV